MPRRTSLASLFGPNEAACPPRGPFHFTDAGRELPFRIRASAALATAPARVRLGQFYTPSRAAALIAEMPHLARAGTLRVLDPGAGTGSLTAALIARILREAPGLEVDAVAVEIDPTAAAHLKLILADCAEVAASAGTKLTTTALQADIIAEATGLGRYSGLLASPFDLIIMNPPYRKLGARSTERQALLSEGVDCPNLYAAFLAIGVQALKPGGQIVAITPRSFANSPYFGAFRRFFLERTTLNRVQVFESRSVVFAGSDVLQENIIFRATKAGDRGQVTHLLASSLASAPLLARAPGQISRKSTRSSPRMYFPWRVNTMTDDDIARRIREARRVLDQLNFDAQRSNERSALVLLALLGLTPDATWADATNPRLRTVEIMGWLRTHYGKDYKPNTRETIRRFTLHQFTAALLVEQNPDQPDRPVNSPKWCYQIHPRALSLLRSVGESAFEQHLREYLVEIPGLRDTYARARNLRRIPVTLPDGSAVTLSPGGQNPLLKQMIEDFCGYFTPGGHVLYAGDADTKWAASQPSRCTAATCAASAAGPARITTTRTR